MEEESFHTCIAGVRIKSVYLLAHNYFDKYKTERLIAESTRPKLSLFSDILGTKATFIQYMHSMHACNTYIHAMPANLLYL